VRWDARAQQLLLPYLWRGDLVGTIARNMTRRPKYQNSPQLAKSRMLFGPSDLRASIVLVEGALDALWFAKHGYNAAALLGSSVSEEQLLLLSHAPEVTLAMDADEAGRVAQQEAIERFQKAGRWDVREATYPEGRKDAQECTSVELASVVAERRIATGGYVAEHR
jgi:DNA primase